MHPSDPPSSKATCLDCGKELLPDIAPCPRCGSERRSVNVQVAGVEALTEMGTPGVVAESRFADNSQAIDQRTPLGTVSKAELTADGDLSVTASGKPDIGRPGEPSVRETLLAHLQQHGEVALLGTGAKDERGEDGVLILDGEPSPLQIVAVPQDKKFWSDAARGGGSLGASTMEAAEWIRSAIQRKAERTPVIDAGKVVLAIDARHIGFLAGAQIVEVYKREYSEFSGGSTFKQVWLVGPTSDHCVRLH